MHNLDVQQFYRKISIKTVRTANSVFIIERLALIMESFRSRLRQALEIKGMKQADLAKVMNTGRSTVSQWISGRNETSSATALKIAQKLNINPVWLVGADVPFSPYSTVIDGLEDKNTVNTIINKLVELDEEQQKMVLGYIDGLLTLQK